MNPLIYDILEGKKSVRHEDLIRTALHFIRSSKGASGVVKQEEPIKAQEAKTIIEFSRKKNLLIRINPKLFVSSGAEQKVYLNLHLISILFIARLLMSSTNSRINAL
jgi:hypothetical protein